MRKRFAFDTAKAIQYAWDLLWQGNLKQRAEDAKLAKRLGKPTVYGMARTYYLTATDLVRAVRELAHCTAKGDPWPTDPSSLVHYYGSQVRMSGDLLGTVRRWLRSNPKLTSHNFGKGHISGERYRPIGEPISEAEKTTAEKKERKRAPDYKPPVHYKVEGRWRALCTHKRMAGKGYGFSRQRSWPRTTDKAADVTCKQCLNLLAAKYNPKATRKEEHAGQAAG